MSFDRDKFAAEIQALSSEEWAPSDGVVLSELIRNPYLLKAFGQVMKVYQDKASQLGGVNLATQEGVADGIKLQGNREGMMQVVEHLCDLAEAGDEGEE